MASQQILFAETIMAMKKARKRKAYDSDSDSEINHQGNRGHKLQKRARFVHEGQLAPPSGPEVYREIVSHAGYQRAIISRNPPLVDDEGYEVDSDDDEEHIQNVADTAAEFNPYASVRLENILAPLTSVTDLPTRPTLSRPYTSKTLTELAAQGCNIMQKENKALWKVKHLQTKLVGDHIWVPCGMFVGPNDIELYRDDYMERVDHAKGSAKSDASMSMLEHTSFEGRTNGVAYTNGAMPATSSSKAVAEAERLDDTDTSMADAEPQADADTTVTETLTHDEEGVGHEFERKSDDGQQDHPASNTAGDPSKSSAAQKTDGNVGNEKQDQPASNVAGGIVTNGSVAGGQQEAGASGAHQRHEVRKEAHQEGNRPMSAVSEPSDALSIHPFFLPPRSAHPDRDLGLPPDEADDMRRLLQLYIQKQEELCRGAKRLYEGLLRADRMRKTVLQWTKYEAHKDMSDGEDWYDKEEWGLEEDLKKGQDEEEEDTTQTTKKTRARR
ncbi:Uu.00g126790.m01.CDS01 [Anthostomella pinea]|uniref:Uu.00g126790.m01.CDS01 n=1 Tax=Anthostomella pinea TaxID=933095 RepID=A0AAI8VI11_9PEZI|nr:Uu.00g126790.m01.CDS01 [Anthostomella pinea]